MASGPCRRLYEAVIESNCLKELGRQQKIVTSLEESKKSGGNPMYNKAVGGTEEKTLEALRVFHHWKI